MVKLTTFLLTTVAIVAVSAQGISQEPVSVSISNLKDLGHVAQEVDVDAEPIHTLPFPSAHVSLEKRAPKPPKKKVTLTKEQKTILNTHNKLRALHGVGPLKWNNNAAKFGNKWTQACKFEHSGGAYGENIAAGYKDFETVINGWYGEEFRYDYSRPGWQDGTGHFTQIVWKDTTSVGCAKKFCPGSNWYMYICNYESAGNIVGDNGNYYRLNVLPKKKN